MSDQNKKSNVEVRAWNSKNLIVVSAVVAAGIIFLTYYFGFKQEYKGVPKRAIAAYHEGVKAIEANDPEKALAELLKAIELDASFADAQARAGEAYFMAAMKHKAARNSKMSKEMLEQSLSYAQKALALNDDNGFAHQVLGYHAYEKANIDEAIKELETAKTSGVSSFELHSMLGFLYNEKQETAKCIDEYVAALKYRSDDRKTLYNLGELFYGVENYQKAVFYYGELLKLEPENMSTKSNYAASLWKSGEVQKAKDIFNQILEMKEGKPFHNYNTVAWVLIDKDVDIEWGIKMAQAANELKPNNIESTDILGWGYFKNKDYANAVKYLNISMKMQPSEEVRQRLNMAKEKLDESDKK